MHPSGRPQINRQFSRMLSEHKFYDVRAFARVKIGVHVHASALYLPPVRETTRSRDPLISGSLDLWMP